MDRQQTADTAVVVGGGIAGLLTARVLADHFARVVILERDRLPERPESRKGVPQGRHAHALLGQGRQIMERLLPGLTESLIGRGAPLGHGRLFSGGGYFARHPDAPPSLYVSRQLLEAELRLRVCAFPQVELLQGCDVLGPAPGADGRCVAGVRLRRGRGDAPAETLPAALVVDAGGRGSRTPAWLEALGYPKPAAELVEVGVGYATRLYERRPADLGGDLMINIAPTPQNRRAAGALAQEGGRWIVTLAGYFGDHPPLDEAGFLAFARKLPTLDLYELIRAARPLSDAVQYKFPSNRRRRYERLAAFPAGLLVIGDAICSFAPIYGQGMSVAAMEALAMQACLAEGRHDLARRFFRLAARAIDNPWSLTVGNDQRLAGAPQPAPRRALNWYLGRYQAAARRDPVLALAIQRVGNLLAPPSSLLHPRLALRVFLGVRPAAAAPGRSRLPAAGASPEPRL
jgi:2-polyprenyl-6-methoxyphenol hydroxylase-like FAD-dependent oxidoreductase